MTTRSEAMKRPWFRFGLRQSFLVITVLALWLGWNVYQVQQRRLVEQYLLSPDCRPYGVTLTYGDPAKPWKTLPIMWQLLGVKPVRHVEMGAMVFPEEEKGYIGAAFPEAEIRFRD